MSEAQVRPDFLKAMESFDISVGAPLDVSLREMLRLRCSHMNGCAFSVRMHSEALAAEGARADLISALARPVKLMREDLVTEAQAAALRFAEVLTDPPRGLEIETREQVARHFKGPQVGAIVEVVALCNAWNRVTRGME